ncbi:MAG: class I SAM-dependent methyltransferase [Acidimicrobiales bacterium]
MGLRSAVRRVIEQVADANPSARRFMGRLGRVLMEASVRPGREAQRTYGGAYFGQGRDASGDRQGRSGYASYDRVSSNADVAGWLLWRTFGGATRTLDVGAATGFLVEVLRERDLDAWGCDVSTYAVEHATPGAAGRLKLADLRHGLPWPDGHFDLVSALETFEHLPPEAIAEVLPELRRVCRGFVYATIPSFGPNNEAGPDGTLLGKVRPEVIDRYLAYGPEFNGPVPYVDLMRDSEGEPIEGHLTIASYEWWTARFEEAGMTRRPDIEARIYDDIRPGGLDIHWNVYVFSVSRAEEAIAQARSPGQSLVDLGLRHPLFAG